MVILHCAELKKNAELAAEARARANETALRCGLDEQEEMSGAPKKKRNPPPIVLTAQRYKKLMAGATGNDLTRAAAERDEEAKYREYLKNGSDELVKHFGTNIKRTQEQKLEDIRLAFEEKKKHAEQANQGLKDSSAAVRLEKLTKAHKIMEKLKPGPRELHSAVMESEILQARNVQLAINEQFQKAVKKQDCLDKMKCDQQTSDYIAEDLKRQAERIENKNQYKIELKQTIDERQELHMEKRRHELREERRAREAIDREVQAEIEKERELMKRKKEAARKNALEAMKIAEQRRIREHMACEIESRIACVFNTGKEQLKRMTAKHAEERKAIKEKRHDDTIQIITSMQKEDPRIKEELSRAKAASEMRLKFTVEEERKKRKYQAAKLARIQAHLDEVQRQKMSKAMAEEQKRFDMAERFKNTEVHCMYKQQMRQKEAQRIQNVRATLARQINEKEMQEQALRAVEIRQCQENIQYLREDKHFFEYAADLMDEARKKGRPLHPYIRAVQQYKRHNGINIPEKLPKHLVSNVNINKKGSASVVCKPKLQAEAEGVQLDPLELKCRSEQGIVKEHILQQCLRIDKLIAEDAAEKRKPCVPHCPIACMQHKQPPGGWNGGRADGLNEISSAYSNVNRLNYDEDCNSLTPSARLRYSVWQLKQLNHYGDGAAGQNEAVPPKETPCEAPVAEAAA